MYGDLDSWFGFKKACFYWNKWREHWIVSTNNADERLFEVTALTDRGYERNSRWKTDEYVCYWMAKRYLHEQNCFELCHTSNSYVWISIEINDSSNVSTLSSSQQRFSTLKFLHYTQISASIMGKELICILSECMKDRILKCKWEQQWSNLTICWTIFPLRSRPLSRMCCWLKLHLTDCMMKLSEMKKRLISCFSDMNLHFFTGQMFDSCALKVAASSVAKWCQNQQLVLTSAHPSGTELCHLRLTSMSWSLKPGCSLCDDTTKDLASEIIS